MIQMSLDLEKYKDEAIDLNSKLKVETLEAMEQMKNVTVNNSNISFPLDDIGQLKKEFDQKFN